MSNPDKVYQRIINSIYLSLSETISKVPFGGKHLLEEITRGVGWRILKENEKQDLAESSRPVDICAAYLKAIGAAERLQIGAIEFEEQGMSVLVTMNRENCIYRSFCEGVEQEGLLPCCPRLGALQSALTSTLGRVYSSKMEFEQGTEKCRGSIFPSERRLRTEMVHRTGDMLTLAGDRVMLFTKDIYVSLLTAIKEYAPFIIKMVLFEAGYRSCLKMAEEALSFYNTPEESLNVCFEELKNCGQGKIELISLDMEAGHAVIRCHQSFEVAAAEGINLYRTPRATCDLLRGELSACLSVITGLTMICVEMQCAVMGSDYCEFHAYSEEEK
jgi:predicted hydrocarbon binding protein